MSPAEAPADPAASHGLLSPHRHVAAGERDADRKRSAQSINGLAQTQQGDRQQEAGHGQHMVTHGTRICNYGALWCAPPVLPKGRTPARRAARSVFV